MKWGRAKGEPQSVKYYVVLILFVLFFSFLEVREVTEKVVIGIKKVTIPSGIKYI